MGDLVFSYADPAAPRVARGLIRLVEAATGQRKLAGLYRDHLARPVPQESFFQSAVRRLALEVEVDPAALGTIPRTGPVVVVANHPYGVLDGLVISWLVEQVRTDFQVLTNAVLLRAPEARRHLLPIDFTGTPAALETNLRSRALARDHLARGGCIVLFPAGAVSTAPDRWGREPAVDGRWQPFAAQLIQKGRTTVVPVCFAGQNSRLFQMASHISQTLRVSLIFREVRRRMGTRVPVTVGQPIPFADLSAIRDRQMLADDLRRRTLALLPVASRTHSPRDATFRLRGSVRERLQPRPR